MKSEPGTTNGLPLVVALISCCFVPTLHAEIVVTGTNGGETIDVSDSTEPHDISAGGGYDTVYGSSAADHISGDAGKDTLFGNGGNDTLVGGTQPDTLFGGDGDDAFVVEGSRASCDLIDGGPGEDSLLGSPRNDILCVAVFDGIEFIDAGDGYDALQVANGSGLVLDLSNVSVAGLELIVGSRNNDVIIGSFGDDVISGDWGHDTLDGGPGVDTAVFYGPLADYHIEVDGNALLVTALSGKERTDTLSNFEWLQFADQLVLVSDYLSGVGPVNDPPVASPDFVSVDEDTAIDIDVLANDTDPNGDVISLLSVGTPDNGVATITPQGQIRYRPDPDFNGEDGFVYEIADPAGWRASASVSITVQPVPDPPLAADDTAQTLIDAAVVVDVLANDTDPDGQALTILSAGAPQNGTAQLVADTLRYVPDTGFEGTDRFDYEVVDADGLTAIAQVIVTVREASPIPESALVDLLLDVPEDSWLQVNLNAFHQVWPDVDQIRSSGGFVSSAKVIYAWSSMAWDRNRDHLIFWGGGHNNYVGNEIYRFDTTTLMWERASLPSAIVDLLGDAQYFAVDGPFNAPISSHTYDNQLFLPLVDRFMTFGGAKFNTGQKFVLEDGSTPTGPYLWDPNLADADKVGGTTGSQVNPALYPSVEGGEMWDNRDTLVMNGQGAIRPSGNFVNATTAYHAHNGKDAVLVTDAPRFGGDLYRYVVESSADPGMDSWELVGFDAVGYSNQGAGAYDPDRKLFVRTAKTGQGWGLVAWDLTIPGPGNGSFIVELNDPAGSLAISKLHGMDFDQVRGAFVLWDGGPQVWYVSPPDGDVSAPWVVTEATVANPNAGPRQTDGGILTYNGSLKPMRGVLGKWKYAPDLDVFLGVIAPVSGDVWVYKPKDWVLPER